MTYRLSDLYSDSYWQRKKNQAKRRILNKPIPDIANRVYSKWNERFWIEKTHPKAILLRRLIRLIESKGLRAGFDEAITDLYLKGFEFTKAVTTSAEAQELRELLEGTDKDIPAKEAEPRIELIKQIIKQLK